MHGLIGEISFFPALVGYFIHLRFIDGVCVSMESAKRRFDGTVCCALLYARRRRAG